jgi:hypothetical protein
MREAEKMVLFRVNTNDVICGAIELRFNWKRIS